MKTEEYERYDGLGLAETTPATRVSYERAEGMT